MAETGEFRSLERKGGNPRARQLHRTSLICCYGGITRELQEFDGVSSAHHPIYYHQNNAENHDFHWY